MAHLLLDPFEKIRKAEDLAEKVKVVPVVVADKIKESGPICVGATIGFLSGVIIGLVLSPVKNGITIASNNTIAPKNKKKHKCCRMDDFDDFDDLDEDDTDF